MGGSNVISWRNGVTFCNGVAVACHGEGGVAWRETGSGGSWLGVAAANKNQARGVKAMAWLAASGNNGIITA